MLHPMRAWGGGVEKCVISRCRWCVMASKERVVDGAGEGESPWPMLS